MTCPACATEAAPKAQFCAACGSALPREAEGDPYLGQVMARKYRVEKLLGEGGMGRVYRANQLVLEKPVVLKLLHPALQKDPRTVARFQREAKAASRLSHPNSIDVLDFGQTDDGALFIAMEFVDGRDLHQVLTEDWPLPEPRIIRIVTQILSALADAHQAGVIHRDLKPENIMVVARRGGESDVVKVLDFGIAKIVDGGAEGGPSLTRTGFVCGTPEYMSPEQARGAPLDARSDLYSVGVLLYQMVTRQLPFSSDSAMGYATKHLTEDPKPPNTLRPGSCSRELEALVLWALRKEPADRPQTAEAFLDSLNLLPAAEAVHAPRTARVPIPLGMTGPDRRRPRQRADGRLPGTPGEARRPRPPDLARCAGPDRRRGRGRARLQAADRECRSVVRSVRPPLRRWSWPPGPARSRWSGATRHGRRSWSRMATTCTSPETVRSPGPSTSRRSRRIPARRSR